MFHELIKNGEFYIDQEKGMLKQLEGILSFIYQVKRPTKESLELKSKEEKEKLRYRPKGVKKLYRKLLFYKNFLVSDKPLLVCEGKTDIVYLKCALKNLEGEYKDLVEKNVNGTEFKIRFLNMSTNFMEVFDMPKGTTGLTHLIEMYKINISTFKNKGEGKPVIIVFDNDSGSKAIKEIIKNTLKIKSVSTNKHYKIIANLYVLFVTDMDNSEIEDLFDKELLETKINGKTFGRGKKIDPKTEYSKNNFAEKVIKKNWETIDFNNFKPFLDKLVKLIN